MAAALRIGLTGGIASGKTAVADMFAARGIPVIDTDQIARKVVAPGQPGLAAVVKAFGRQILQPDGRLDRQRLRGQIFADAAARKQLEAILHPLIHRATETCAQASDGPYVIIAVPLLAETGFDVQLSRILVVDCPPELQLERLMSRDQETEAAARKILAAQVSRDERLAIADDVIDNTGSLGELENAVESLHRRYLELAGAGRD